jgi:hypothetical protein
MPRRWVAENPNLRNAPPGWAKVDALLREFRPPSTFGFVGTAGDLNRFWSRYRLAKSFRGVTIEIFSDDTVRGYSTLFRLFLVWSAFEQFMRITGLHFRTSTTLLEDHEVEALDAAIRAHPDYAAFLSAVHAELDRRPHIDNMQAFLRGEPCNILVVPAAIRHIFAHGKLTPNSGVGNVAAACAVSDLLCDFLFTVMDRGFLARLRANGVLP